jgi:galactokinase
VNLVEQDQAKAFAAELGKRYAAKTGITPEIHICHASDGAHRIS